MIKRSSNQHSTLNSTTSSSSPSSGNGVMVAVERIAKQQQPLMILNHHNIIMKKRNYVFSIISCIVMISFIIIFFRYEQKSIQSSLSFISTTNNDNNSNLQENGLVMIRHDDDITSTGTTTTSSSTSITDTPLSSNEDEDKVVDVDNDDKSASCRVDQQCSISFKKVNINIDHHRDMALCYFLPYGKNFGDELGPAMSLQLIKNYFQCNHTNNTITVLNLGNSKHMKLRTTNHIGCLFTLGSIMHFVNPYDHIWGTGINPYRLQKKLKGILPNHIIIHSTRGPQTLQIFHNDSNYHNITSLPKHEENIVSKQYGDPGFLLPTLYPQYKPQQNNNLKVRYCVIPHVQDLKLPEILEISKKAKTLEKNNKKSKYEIKIISPHDSWENVVKQIALCHYVASSSLHGLIVADSLYIPTLWFQFDAKLTSITEGTFKYNDYYNGILQYNRIPMKDLKTLLNISSYIAPPIKNLQDQYISNMIQSFPYDLFERKCI